MTPVTSAYRNLEWRISFIAKTCNFLLEILSGDKNQVTTFLFSCKIYCFGMDSSFLQRSDRKAEKSLGKAIEQKS